MAPEVCMVPYQAGHTRQRRSAKEQLARYSSAFFQETHRSKIYINKYPKLYISAYSCIYKSNQDHPCRRHERERTAPSPIGKNFSRWTPLRYPLPRTHSALSIRNRSHDSPSFFGFPYLSTLPSGSYLYEKSFMNHLRAFTRSIGFLRQLTLSPKSLSALSPSLRTNPFHLTIQPTIPKRTMASAMAKRLEGKTVVVTGASAGIGRSTAKEFARTSPKNLKIVVTARRIDSLNELAQEIKEEVGEGVKVLPVKLDVSNPEEVRGFVSGLPAEFQDIDILVNNA